MKIFVVIAMLSLPAFVELWINLRVKRIEFYGDTYAIMNDLMSWNESLSKGLMNYFWPNLFYYLSPHITLIVVAILLRLRFKLIVRALVIINLVLILFSFWIYGRANLPDSPLLWIFYLPVEVACLAIFFICTRFLTQKGKVIT
jgi:hypothetical protein